MPTGHRQAPDTVGMIQPTPVRASAAAPLRPHHSLPPRRALRLDKAVKKRIQKTFDPNVRFSRLSPCRALRSDGRPQWNDFSALFRPSHDPAADLVRRVLKRIVGQVCVTLGCAGVRVPE